MQIKNETTPRYLTVKQLAAMGFLPEGGIRHLIFSSEEFNQKVVRRLGKKVLINVDALYEFIDQKKSAQGG